MPVFEYQCPACYGTWEQYVPRHDIKSTCDKCSIPGKKVYMGSINTVRDDSIIGGRWIENLGHQPVYVESVTELKRQMKAHGVEEFVRHTPVPGSDKSQHTSNWSSVSKETLEDTKALLEQHEQRDTRTLSGEKSHGFTWSVRERQAGDLWPQRTEGGVVFDGPNS